jgi:heme exporter protein C
MQVLRPDPAASASPPTTTPTSTLPSTSLSPSTPAHQPASAPVSAPMPGPLERIWPYVDVVLRPVRRYGLAALGALTALGMILSIWGAFLLAPTDAVQGDVQRIFYFHVPLAWDAYLAFFIVFVASIVYLWRKDERWDWLARASAEIGTIFTTLTLIIGSIWGRAVWGTWWQWDPRLTTTLILWFIYVGYLMLRSSSGAASSGARAAAVLGIVGFVDVPIDYLSVTWWRSLHPASTYIMDNGSAALPPAALFAFFVSLITFTLLFAFLLVLVYRLQRLQSLTRTLRGRIELD